MIIRVEIEWRDDLVHVEVPVSWETDERGSGWVMDYCSGDQAFDDLVADAAFKEADREVRDARCP